MQAKTRIWANYRKSIGRSLLGPSSESSKIFGIQSAKMQFLSFVRKEKMQEKVSATKPKEWKGWLIILLAKLSCVIKRERREEERQREVIFHLKAWQYSSVPRWISFPFFIRQPLQKLYKYKKVECWSCVKYHREALAKTCQVIKVCRGFGSKRVVDCCWLSTYFEVCQGLPRFTYVCLKVLQRSCQGF